MSRFITMITTMLLAAAGTASACGSVPEQEDRVEQLPTPDPGAVTEALRFGGIVLPAGATVLAVEHEQGIDRLYRLAVRVEPDGTAELLAGSGFTTTLRAGRRVFLPPVAGIDLDQAGDIASAQDRLPPAGDRTAMVTREVLVDRGDPDAPVVHLWLFRT